MVTGMKRQKMNRIRKVSGMQMIGLVVVLQFLEQKRSALDFLGLNGLSLLAFLWEGRLFDLMLINSLGHLTEIFVSTLYSRRLQYGDALILNVDGLVMYIFHYFDRSKENLMEGSIESELQVNYNNIHKVLWEPFLEPWKLQPGSSYPMHINDTTPDEQIFKFKTSHSSDNLANNIGVNNGGDMSKGFKEFDRNKRLHTSNGYVVLVIIDVSVERYTKLVRLYSMVILLNETSVPFEVRFDIPFGVSPKVAMCR
nr:hypothetical protein [Tanacetum cinerariifolium]